jgi:hypothetical protein
VVLVAASAVLVALGGGAYAHFPRNAPHDFSVASTAEVLRWNWMAELRDDIPLTELSIPGTHDSGSYNKGGPLVLTQSMNIWEQLLAGIRALDVRLHLDDDGQLRVYHGDVSQEVDFDEHVLWPAKGFLQENPTETILMRIKYESGPTDGFEAALDGDLEWYIENGWIYTGSDDTPTLGAVRGKILILWEWGGRPNSNTPWGVNWGHTKRQDKYSIDTFHDLPLKWRAPGNCPDNNGVDFPCDIHEHFRAADRLAERAYYYVNFLSASGGVFPITVASGHHDQGSAGPDSRHVWSGWFRRSDGSGCTGPPDNCLPELPESCDDAGTCTVFLEGMNILAANFLRNGGVRWRAGIVMADFPGSALIDAIIARNPRPPIAYARRPDLPGGAYTAKEGTSLELQGHATDGNGDPLTFGWELDGSIPADYADATVANPSYTWEREGVAVVLLRVTDPFGYSDVDSAQVVIENVPPRVEVVDAMPAKEGHTATVTGTIHDDGFEDDLSATISWGDGSAPESVTQIGLDKGTPTKLEFEATHEYADDGVYDIAVCPSDPEPGPCLQSEIVISNADPTVALVNGGSVEISEGTQQLFAADYQDPGWDDVHSGVLSTGTGTTWDLWLDVTHDDHPARVGKAEASHQYGDNGNYTATVTITDDDGGAGTDTQLVKVNNVAPTAAIERTGQLSMNGSTVFFAHAGSPLELSARMTDPGSDDLTATWSFGDGSVVPPTIYLAAPPTPDAPDSPSVNPRDVTDAMLHSYARPCVYDVEFAAVDDDGEGRGDADVAVVTGNAALPRGHGYWRQETRAGRLDQPSIGCALEIANLLSRVFSEVRPAGTTEQAYALLSQPPRGEMRQILDRELLSAWLNFAAGALDPDDSVDTDGDGIADSDFAHVLAAAEDARLDPAATRATLEHHARIVARVNGM